MGELSPKIGDNKIPRSSLDKHTNSRATWVIELCEVYSWYILNGLQPGPTAQYTFARGSDRSCIDLILAKNVNYDLQYDPDTLRGFSDHVLIST